MISEVYQSVLLDLKYSYIVFYIVFAIISFHHTNQFGLRKLWDALMLFIQYVIVGYLCCHLIFSTVICRFHSELFLIVLNHVIWFDIAGSQLSLRTVVSTVFKSLISGGFVKSTVAWLHGEYIASL